MRSLVLVAVLVASGACAPGDSTIDVVFDACEPLGLTLGEDTSESERASAGEAAAMWNALGTTQLGFDTDQAGGARLPVRFEEAPLTFYGLYEDELGEVLVNRRLTDPRARAVTLAHEIGHAFGLSHVDPDVRPSVMNTANLTLAPTAEDAAALTARWGGCARP